MTQPPTKSMTLAALAELTGATLDGPADLEITGVAALQVAGPNDMTFYYDDRHRHHVADSKAGAILIDVKSIGDAPAMPTLRTSNPRLAMALVVDAMYPASRPAPGVHATAVVPASCTVGDAVHMGPYVVLGERVTIGDNAILHTHAVVYDDAVIGDNVTLHSHAVVRERVQVGAHAVLQNGAVVGGDGFGFAPRADGSWHPIRQVGSVRLGDYCEVHANACIDRGALHDTVVGEGSKIDNLAQLGHGVQIGKHTLICGQVGLAGSSTVGDHAILGGQVGVADHIHIGDRARLAAQTGVMTDLEGNADYAGAPATPIRRTMLIHAALQRLPETVKRLKQLERRLQSIEASALEE